MTQLPWPNTWPRKSKNEKSPRKGRESSTWTHCVKKSGLGPKRVAGILIVFSPNFHSETLCCIYIVDNVSRSIVLSLFKRVYLDRCIQNLLNLNSRRSLFIYRITFKNILCPLSKYRLLNKNPEQGAALAIISCLYLIRWH